MTSFARSASSRSLADRALLLGLPLTAAATGLVVFGVAGFVALEAAPALRRVGLWSALTDGTWHPLEGSFGMAAMLGATLCIGFGAVLVATPLGIASAAFARVWAPRPLARALRIVLVLLAGVPSVVFGQWGLTVLVPWIGAWRAPGASLLAAVLVLALMILPTIALSADAALAGVAPELRRGAAALGLRRGAALVRVVLPAAWRGIAAGIVLALGRAIGETMAVVMVAGNVVQWPDSVFAPVRTLTANIALEMGYAARAHRSALFLGGLLLLAVVGTLAWLGEHFGRRHRA